MALSDGLSTPTFKDATLTRWAGSVVTAVTTIVKFLEPWRKPEPWKKCTLHGNWVALGGASGTYKTAWFDPAFVKDPNGIVRLRGVVKQSGGSDTVMTQLPVGYRPQQSMIFPTIADNSVARVDIDQDGRVIYAFGGATPGYVTLDGISFDTRGQNGT